MASRRDLSFDGKLFFLYDREAVTSEADPPENAIIYFYPTSATIESRISICGQLVGMSNFLSTVLDFAPVMVNLKTEKVALYQSGQYTLGLGGSVSEPETLLLKQLQTLFDIFVFYHGSLDTVRQLSRDHASFLSNMSIIWDCYIHFIRHYGDTLPAVFNPLPFFKSPKNSSQSCFLKASHILQASQRRQHILAGCILHQKSVLCTQLETSITKRLLLLKPNQSHHPGKQVKTGITLPFGVRFLDSFVTCCEYDRLVTSLRKSPYHNSIKRNEPRPSRDKSTHQKSKLIRCGAAEQSNSGSAKGNKVEVERVIGKDGVRKEAQPVPEQDTTCTSKLSSTIEENGSLSKLNEPTDDSSTRSKRKQANQMKDKPSPDCGNGYYDKIDDSVPVLNGDIDDSLFPLNEDINDSVPAPSRDINDSVIAPSRDINDSVIAPSRDINDSVIAPSRDINESVTAPSRDINDSVPAPSRDINDSVPALSRDINDFNASNRDINDGVTALKGDIIDGLPAPNRDINESAPALSRDISDSLPPLNGCIAVSAPALNTNINDKAPFLNGDIDESVPNMSVGIVNSAPSFSDDVGDCFENCLSTSPDDDELTMDEINISGLRIVNGPSEDATTLDPQTEDICKEILDSLIEQVNKPLRTNFDNSIERELNDASRQNVRETNDDLMFTSNNVTNFDDCDSGDKEVLAENTPLSSGIDTNVSEPNEDDCVCDIAIDNSNSLTKIPLYLPVNSPTTLPQELVSSPVEEFHDTVEDLANEEEIKLTQKTVDAYLQSYRDLRTNDLGVSKYSALNLNLPDDKKVEKNFFKDLVVTGNTVVDKSSRAKENDSATSQENGLGSGRESSLSSESPNPECPGNCQNTLGDSGLCLYHGSSESSLSQTDVASSVNSHDLQQESSVDFSEHSSFATVDLELSTDTLREEERQEEQAEYVDDFDESLYQIDGLVHVNLYVQAHSNTVLILLAEASLSEDQETIKALWKTTLNELGELEIHLNQCSQTGTERHDKHDDYSFVVYDAISSTTKGNLTEPVEQVDFKFCDTAKTVHEQFNNCTSLKSVTLRDNSAAVHCQRSLGQEVYVHKKGVLKPFRGSPSIRDSAFSLERRVRKQLKKDHGVNVI